MRWQYQVRAEPLLAIAESITPDKWSPVYPALDRRKPALIAAIVVGAFFFGDVPRAEATSVDRWNPVAPEQLRPQNRVFWQGQSVIDPAPLAQSETITPDKWAPVYPSRLNPAKRALWAGDFAIDPFGLTQPEAATLDRWKPTYPDRLDPKRRIFPIDWGTADAWLAHVPGVELITIDKWIPVYPSRIDRKRGAFWEGISVTDPAPRAESVSIDRWTAVYPNRLDVRPRAQFPDSFLVEAPGSRIDFWEPTYPSRLNPRRNVFPWDQSTIDANFGTPPVVEVVTLDKWNPVQVYLKPAQVPLYWLSYGEINTIVTGVHLPCILQADAILVQPVGYCAEEIACE